MLVMISYDCKDISDDDWYGTTVILAQNSGDNFGVCKKCIFCKRTQQSCKEQANKVILLETYVSG